MKYLMLVVALFLTVGCERTDEHLAVLNQYGENTTPVATFSGQAFDVGQCVTLLDQYSIHRMRAHTSYKIPYEFRSKQKLMVKTEYTTYVFIFENNKMINVWSKGRPKDKNDAETARQVMSNLCFNAYIQQTSLN